MTTKWINPSCGFSKNIGHGVLRLAAASFALGSLCAAHATETPPSEDIRPSNGEVSPIGDFCFLPGVPPSDIRYVRLRDVKVGKHSYGSVRTILDDLAEQARRLEGDALINYSGSQRFGFWPWQMVRPVARGTAIRWEGSTKPDCKSIGGSTLSEILLQNQPPGQ